MKTEYTPVDIRVIEFAVNDIIVTSDYDPENQTGIGEP